MSRKPPWASRAIVAATALGVVVASACGGSKVSNNGNDGSGLSGWTFLPTGSDSGAVVGTGGAAAGSGGAAGIAGAAGSLAKAGSGGTTAVVLQPFACNAKAPDQPVITHFDGFMKDRWISGGNLDGGVYIYPDGLLLKDGDFLRFADSVTTYAGVGVWFSGCIDASKYRGVRFTVSGSIPTARNVTMYAISNRNRDIDEDDGVGACAPADPQDTWPTCHPAGLKLTVTSDATTQEIPFSAFTNGLPSATTDGSDLLALQWSFDWDDALNPYDAELIIDNLEFYSDSGGGGSGGAAGSAATGGGGGGGGGGGSSAASGGQAGTSPTPNDGGAGGNQ